MLKQDDCVVHVIGVTFDDNGQIHAGRVHARERSVDPSAAMTRERAKMDRARDAHLDDGAYERVDMVHRARRQPRLANIGLDERVIDDSASDGSVYDDAPADDDDTTSSSGSDDDVDASDVADEATLLSAVPDDSKFMDDLYHAQPPSSIDADDVTKRFMVLFVACAIAHKMSRRACNDVLRIYRMCHGGEAMNMATVLTKLSLSKRRHTTQVVCPGCNALHTHGDEPDGNGRGGRRSRMCGATIIGGARCDALLMKTRGQNRYGITRTPKLSYAYYSLIEQIALYVRRPGAEEELDAWRNKTHDPTIHSDITNSASWRQQRDPHCDAWFFARGRGRGDLHGEGKEHKGMMNNRSTRARRHDNTDDAHPINDGDTLTIGLGINVDWLLLYTGMLYSLGVILVYMMNLPAHQRHQQHQTLFVGCMPYNALKVNDLNHYMARLVDELLLLSRGVRMVTAKYPHGRLVRAVLSVIISDAPATKKLLGAQAPVAAAGCHMCHVTFGSIGDHDASHGHSGEQKGNDDIIIVPRVIDDHDGIDGNRSGDDDSDDDHTGGESKRSSKPVRPRVLGSAKKKQAAAIDMRKKRSRSKAAAGGAGAAKPRPKSRSVRDYMGGIAALRTTSEVIVQGELWRAATTDGERLEIARTGGWKYSILHKLTYLDIPAIAMVDVMHCITLGVAKKMVYMMTQSWTPDGVQHTLVNQRLAMCRPPSSLPRPIRSLQSDLSSITAAQMAIFTAGPSMIVFHDVVKKCELKMWSHMVTIQRLCYRYQLNDNDVVDMERSINYICDQWRTVWPASGGMPNLHYMRHLPACIRLYGAPYNISTYPTERFNGWVKHVRQNGIHVEHQLMQQHIMLVTLASVTSSYVDAHLDGAAMVMLQKLLRIGSAATIIDDDTASYARSLPTSKTIVNGSEGVPLVLHSKHKIHPLDDDVRDKLMVYLRDVVYASKKRTVTITAIGTTGIWSKRCMLGYRMITSDEWSSTREAYIVAHYPRMGGHKKADNSWLTPGRVKWYIQVPVTMTIDGVEQTKHHTFAHVVWFAQATATGVAICLEDSGWSTTWLNRPKLLPGPDNGIVHNFITIGRIAGTFMPIMMRNTSDTTDVMWTSWLPPHF